MRTGPGVSRAAMEVPALSIPFRIDGEVTLDFNIRVDFGMDGSMALLTAWEVLPPYSESVGRVLSGCNAISVL